jgi:hypothetical protein
MMEGSGSESGSIPLTKGDPGGPKTYGSYGSGTLLASNIVLLRNKERHLHSCLKSLAELATLQMFWKVEQGVRKMVRISET